MRLAIVVFGLSLLVIGCNPVKSTAAVNQAVKDFHAQLDAGKFKEIYDGTHADFQAASTEKDFTAILDAIHRKLGNIQTTTRVSWNMNTYNFKTNVTESYETTFAEGKGTESFNYRIKDGKAVLYGYNINSTELITK